MAVQGRRSMLEGGATGLQKMRVVKDGMDGLQHNQVPLTNRFKDKDEKSIKAKRGRKRGNRCVSE